MRGATTSLLVGCVVFTVMLSASANPFLPAPQEEPKPAPGGEGSQESQSVIAAQAAPVISEYERRLERIRNGELVFMGRANGQIIYYDQGLKAYIHVSESNEQQEN